MNKETANKLLQKAHDIGVHLGRKEVVDWIDKNVCYPYPVGSSGYKKWRRQRRKWGIENGS